MDMFREHSPAVTAAPGTPASPTITELWFREWRAQNERKLDAEAKEKGFSSWAEEKAHQDVQERELVRLSNLGRDERVRQLGLTREQYEAEQEANDPQRWTPRPWVLEPIHTVCTHECEDHAIPSFCAASLVNYSSQDLPDEMAQLNSRHRLSLKELNIRPDIQPTVLSSVVREMYWERNSQEQPKELPNWAYGDQVLRQMLPSHFWTDITPPGCSTRRAAQSSISTTPTQRSPAPLSAQVEPQVAASGPDMSSVPA